MKYKLSEHQNWVRSFISLDKERYASCSDDGIVKIYDKHFRTLYNLKEHNECVLSVCLLRDGRIVPKDLYKAYKDGKSAWCEMINGTNRDECRYWINEMGGLQIYAAGIPLLFDNQLAIMSKKDQKAAREYFRKNEDGTAYLRITEFENDIIFRCPAQKQLQYHC